MNRIPCHIIRDLLPLYLDGVCAEPTVRDVEEHLRNCAACQKLRENLAKELPTPVPLPKTEKTALFRLARRRLLGTAAVLTVMAGSFAANAAGAWLGGPASWGNLAVTVVYIAFWGALTAVSRRFEPLCRLSLGISLATLLSAMAGLAGSLFEGGFLTAFLAAFAAIPFYGLSVFLSWEALYGTAAVLSLGAAVCAWRLRRRLFLEREKEKNPAS